MEERGTRREMQEGFVGHNLSVLLPDRCFPQCIPALLTEHPAMPYELSHLNALWDALGKTTVREEDGCSA
jgi:hypothetical protein